MCSIGLGLFGVFAQQEISPPRHDLPYKSNKTHKSSYENFLKLQGIGSLFPAVVGVCFARNENRTFLYSALLGLNKVEIFIIPTEQNN